MPITWRNVGTNFSDSNQLLMNGGKTISNSFANLGNVLKQQGEYNKEKNTAEAVAAFGAVQDAENLAQKRQEIVDRWRGKNVDMAAISSAGDDRMKTLQDNVLFGQKKEKNAFDLANQDEKFGMEQEAHKSDMATDNISRDLLKQDYNYKTPAARAARAEKEHENAKEIANIKNWGKKDFNGPTPDPKLIETISNNLGERTETTQGKVYRLAKEYPDVSTKEFNKIVNSGISDLWWGGFKFGPVNEALELAQAKAIAAKLARANANKSK